MDPAWARAPCLAACWFCGQAPGVCHSAVWVGVPGRGLSLRCHLFGERQGRRHCERLKGAGCGLREGWSPATRPTAWLSAQGAEHGVCDFGSAGRASSLGLWSPRACCRTRWPPLGAQRSGGRKPQPWAPAWSVWAGCRPGLPLAVLSRRLAVVVTRGGTGIRPGPNAQPGAAQNLARLQGPAGHSAACSRCPVGTAAVRKPRLHGTCALPSAPQARGGTLLPAPRSPKGRASPGAQTGRGPSAVPRADGSGRLFVLPSLWAHQRSQQRPLASSRRPQGHGMSETRVGGFECARQCLRPPVRSRPPSDTGGSAVSSGAGCWGCCRPRAPGSGVAVWGVLEGPGAGTDRPCRPVQPC